MTDHPDRRSSPDDAGHRPWVLPAAAAAAVAVLVVGVVGVNLLHDDPPAAAAPATTSAAASTSAAPSPASSSPVTSSPVTTTAPSTTTAAATTSPAPSSAAPDYPPQLDFDQANGGAQPVVWAVYLAVDADPADPELTRAATAATQVGYTVSDQAIACSSPGVDGLGVPSSYAFRVLYFSTGERAQAFVDAYPPGVVGTVRTTLACDDGAGGDQPAG